MKKERNVRKMSECTFLNAKHDYNAKFFKNVIKLFILTILNVSKRPLRNLEEPLSLSTGPQTPTLPAFYLYGLTISLTSTSRLSKNPSLQKIWNTIPALSLHSTSFMPTHFSSPGFAKSSTPLNFEAIPSQFKAGIIVPIYKGKGKEPLLPGS